MSLAKKSMDNETLLEWLRQRPKGVTIKELSAVVGWSGSSPKRLKKLRRTGVVVAVGAHAHVRLCVPEHAHTALDCSNVIRQAKAVAAKEWKRLYDVEKGKRRRELLRGQRMASESLVRVDDDEAEVWPVVHRWVPAGQAARLAKPCAASVWELAA